MILILAIAILGVSAMIGVKMKIEKRKNWSFKYFQAIK